jgi:hypothetical protein
MFPDEILFCVLCTGMMHGFAHLRTAIFPPTSISRTIDYVRAKSNRCAPYDCDARILKHAGTLVAQAQLSRAVMRIKTVPTRFG